MCRMFLALLVGITMLNPLAARVANGRPIPGVFTFGNGVHGVARDLGSPCLNRRPVVAPTSPRSDEGAPSITNLSVTFNVGSDVQGDRLTRGTTLAQLRAALIEAIDLGRRRDP